MTLVALPQVTALTRHRELARRCTPERRAVLVAAAWRAGETDMHLLAYYAGVSRDTIYSDLAKHGIYTDGGKGYHVYDHGEPESKEEHEDSRADGRDGPVSS
jgi:hypothetical protein